MAKRPRMGRNLDALLGGASSDRSGKSASARRASTTSAVAHEADDPEPETISETSADMSMESVENPRPAAPTDKPVVETAASSKSSETPAATVTAVTPTAETAPPANGKEQLIMLGVEKIRRGSYQPRRLFDQELLQELADSIKAEGMIQPIIVRPFADGYELVAGERRWRASQLAGINQIPAIVRSMEDQSVAAVSVIENIQRKDLNPLEEAAAFERLCDEFGMTHKAVAESVGRSRAAVTNLMRLLELHNEVKLMVDNGELDMGHARALLGAPQQSQPRIAAKIIKQGMTVRAVEKYIRALDEDGKEVPASAKGGMHDPDIDRLSKKLSETLGAAVAINHKPNGGGKLQISYTSVVELQGILAHIK